MSEALKTTVNKSLFEKVFVEVPFTGSLGVRAQEQLKLFRIREIFDNNFDIEALRSYVAKNIGYYVFSRSKLH